MRGFQRIGLGGIALTLLAGSACGYHLVGSKGVVSTVLPPDARVIAVEPFENRTDRPEIEQRVTEQVTRELSRRGRYEVLTTRQGADALIEGAITDYRTRPVQISSETGRSSRREAVVTIEATVRDLANDEVLWSQRGLVYRQQFDVPDEGEFFDRESAALDLLAREVAGGLITSILEGF